MSISGYEHADLEDLPRTLNICPFPRHRRARPKQCFLSNSAPGPRLVGTAQAMRSRTSALFVVYLVQCSPRRRHTLSIVQVFKSAWRSGIPAAPPASPGSDIKIKTPCHLYSLQVYLLTHNYFLPASILERHSDFL